MDLMSIRRGLLAQMAAHSNIRMDHGTFTPTIANVAITIQHNLGAIPKVWFCYPQNDTAISQTTAQIVSYWENVYGEDLQIIARSRNGVQFNSIGGISDSMYVTQATANEIKFGGLNGVQYGWAVNEPHEWYAIYWQE